MIATSQRFALVLALALGATAAGCSSSEPDHPGDDTGGGDDGRGDTGGGAGSQRALDATGTYTVHSTFDIASNVPGTVGTVVNDIIDATDGPNDPTDWLLTLIINQLPSGTRSVLNLGKALAEGFLNRELKHIAPDFVTTILQVGQDFGDITKHFGLIETLDVTGTAGAYTAKHTVTGAHFKLGTVEADFLLANYSLPNIEVDKVAFTMDPTGAITIASHDVPLAYGEIAKIGLNAAIIPIVDPMAQNLNELLADLIDCTSVGQGIADAIGVSSLGGALSAGCSLGLDAAANLIYTKIGDIDGNALKFALTGTAKGLDTDGDGKIDSITSGGWTGMLSYGNAPTPLAPATFSGARNR
ncbi:MAG TPA: hypothetical protein VFP84_23905 [Kofleriaceae bacterium]|nr:hypothetical protein [Kofleriaceae bacterium]